MKRFLLLFLLVSLLGFTVAQSTFSSAARQSVRFALEPVDTRGVSGSVLLSDYGREQTVLVVDLPGLQPNQLYSVRLRQGTCGDAQGLVRFLGTLSGRSGLMTHVLNTPYEQLRGMNFHVEVSEPLNGVVACGTMGPAVTPLAERLPGDRAIAAPEEPEPAPTEDIAAPEDAADAEEATAEEPVEVVEQSEEEAVEEDATEAMAEARVVEVRIAGREDDAQEFLDQSSAGHPPGFMHLHSRYIALTNNPEGWGTDQAVGLRFADLDIPQGAEIERAYVQFTVYEANDGPTRLTVRAEAADDAPTFQEGEDALFNISRRPTTSAAQTWEPPAWEEVGAAGEAQRTPDLTNLIQEVVDRPGWEAGNALVLIITGESPDQGRMAVAHREDPDRAPLLVVEYREGN